MSMTPYYNRYEAYKGKISELPSVEQFESKHLLNTTFQLERADNLEVYYAPLDYINTQAEIILVGITPGWHQMEIAFRTARENILDGLGRVEVCRRAKKAAAFSGAMRKNLLEMLDGIGIPKAMGIESSGDLFAHAHMRLHSTSVLRYPVFVDGKNYAGHRPPILSNSLLKRYVDEEFCGEIEIVHKAFIIPLGKAVNKVLEYLVNQGRISGDLCCFGFPHPSGANAHRKGQFKAQQQVMKKKVRRWFRG